jgi:hypothetical protein
VIRNNVPFDMAWELDQAELLAYTVVFAAFDGQEFDWVRMEFKQK